LSFRRWASSSGAQAYIGLFKPVLWLRLRFPFTAKQTRPKYEMNERYIGKCRIAGIFGLTGVAVFAYSLYVNVAQFFEAG
jgi:hypothetical protein